MNYTRKWKKDAPDHWSRNEHGLQLCVWPMLGDGYTWEVWVEGDDDPIETGESDSLEEAKCAADEEAVRRLEGTQ